MTNRVIPPLPDRTRLDARRLRRAMTEAESRLWHFLRAGRLYQLKFRRQHPFPPYVLDFFCKDAQLVVEVDGSQHGVDADANRTAYLERQGLRVIRFWDNDVLCDTKAVLEVILSAARECTLTPTPLPEGEGL